MPGSICLFDAVVNPTFPEAEIKKLLALRIDRGKVGERQSRHHRPRAITEAFLRAEASLREACRRVVVRTHHARGQSSSTTSECTRGRI